MQVDQPGQAGLAAHEHAFVVRMDEGFVRRFLDAFENGADASVTRQDGARAEHLSRAGVEHALAAGDADRARLGECGE